jgi:hypothetical protein
MDLLGYFGAGIFKLTYDTDKRCVACSSGEQNKETCDDPTPETGRNKSRVNGRKRFGRRRAKMER